MKTALVLSGGGSKGCMQFGMIKYLYEQGLKPDAIYGTSVGSLNAAGLSFCGIEGVDKIWHSLTKTSDIFKMNLLFFLGMSSGLYNAKPLKKLLEKYLVGEPKVDSYCSKVHLETGELKYSHCKDKDYIDSTVASCSIPAFTDDIDGWVDGGVRDQTPLKKAIQDGADNLIVVLCNPIKKDPPPGKKGWWIRNLLRTTDILSHEVFISDLQSCLWYNARYDLLGKKHINLTVYAPRELVIDSHTFTQDKIKPAIEYGYQQAKLGPISLDLIYSL